MFFTAGACMAVCGKDRLRFERPVRNKAALLIPVFWVSGCTGYMFLCASPGAANMPDMFLTIANRICMALGVVSVFVLYDFIPAKEQRRDNSRIPAPTFVIYMLHEPLQHFIFQYIFLKERSDALHLIVFFCLPVLLVLFCMLVSSLLSRFAPELRSFLTGGR